MCALRVIRVLETGLEIPGKIGSMPTDVQDMAAAPSNRIDRACYGVGGWLLFFIFSLVFIGPGTRVIGFLGTYRHNLQIFARSPHRDAYYAYYFVEQFVRFTVYAYGIFAGIQLWRIRPEAVRQAKLFLLSILLFALADYAFGAMWIDIFTPERTRASVLSRFLSGPIAIALIETTFYATIWYFYLLKSQRVRATFSQELPTAVGTTGLRIHKDTLSNTAQVVTAGDSNTANDSSTDSTAKVIPPGIDLSINQVIFGANSDGTLPAGQNLSLLMQMNNAGTAATSGTITFSDNFPSGFNIISILDTASPGILDTASQHWTCNTASQLVTCTNSSPIEPRFAIALTVKFTIDPSLSGTTVSNTAAVSTPGDVFAGDDSTTSNFVIK
jgi:hypothetical protein